jgi:glycerol-3-phosphate dehydrogenase
VKTLDVDVAVIGAGVIGCAIAAKLSTSGCDVCVLERRADVCDETSKATSAITDSGWESDPASLEGQLIARSSPRWEEIAARLNVPFVRTGVLLVASTVAQVAALDHASHAAADNGVPARRWPGAEASEQAPYLGRDVLEVLEIPQDGVVDPVALTLGYARLAARNGTRFLLSSPLQGAMVSGERVVELHTPRVVVRPRFVVNAAGLGADDVSRTLAAEDFQVWPRRGEYLVLAPSGGPRIDRIVARPPSDLGGGVMVIPTPAGRLLLGPTAEDGQDKRDVSTSAATLDAVFAACQSLVPGLRREHAIASFTGLRASSDRTYRIERSALRANLVQACGIRSTGIASSPAVADLVHELLVDAGLRGTSSRPTVERLPLITTPPGSAGCSPIVCVCQRVSTAEIRDALTGEVPARSVRGVAKRTGATLGRCQGDDCLSMVVALLTAELDVAPWAAPFDDAGGTVGVAPSQVP